MSARIRQNNTWRDSLRSRFLFSLPPRFRLVVAILLAILGVIAGVQLYQVGLKAITQGKTIVSRIENHFAPQSGNIVLAPLFRPEVSYWEEDILRWSEAYQIEPNLLATVMQIESCGHPTVNSYAGAQGLFQVMPFHFAEEENMLDPDTNALRGANFLNQCLGWADGDVGLALACYNGGPSVLQKNPAYWDQQVHNYYKWGVPIYADALVSKPESETLNQWLAAGGQRLCDSAANEIGLR